MKKPLIISSLSEVASLTSTIVVLPIQERITTDDGRSFTLTNPLSVVKNSMRASVDMLVDYEHDSMKKEGSHRSVAAGWIKRLSTTESAIVAEVEWTASALEKIQNKEYRYISPVLMHTPEGEIIRIKNVALTNEPALPLEVTEPDKGAQKREVTTKQEQDDKEKGEKAASLSVEDNKEQLISLLSSEYGLDGLNRRDLESVLNRADKMVKDDVEDARSKYLFPRNVEDELTLLRSTLGAERFREATAKLSLSGFGFAHLKTQQTTQLGINPTTRYQHEQRDYEDRLACEITGVTQEEFLKAKNKRNL